MRIESGYDLLDLWLRRDDFIYPSKSPTPAPKMCGCSGAERQRADQCEALEYSYDGLCRAPESWVSGCPNAVENKRVAHVPQKQKYVEARLPPVLGMNRQQRRVLRIQAWVGFRLECYLPDEVACVMLGKDAPISRAEYDRLAERLFEDFVDSGGSWWYSEPALKRVRLCASE